MKLAIANRNFLDFSASYANKHVPFKDRCPSHNLIKAALCEVSRVSPVKIISFICANERTVIDLVRQAVRQAGRDAFTPGWVEGRELKLSEPLPCILNMQQVYGRCLMPVKGLENLDVPREEASSSTLVGNRGIMAVSAFDVLFQCYSDLAVHRARFRSPNGQPLFIAGHYTVGRDPTQAEAFRPKLVPAGSPFGRMLRTAPALLPARHLGLWLEPRPGNLNPIRPALADQLEVEFHTPELQKV